MIIKEFSNFSQISKVDIREIKRSVPLTNNRDILQWQVDNISNSLHNNKKDLANNISVELTDIFGPHNKGMRLEYLTKVWVLSFKNINFNLFCSRKGTYIEVCDMTTEQLRNNINRNVIIEFLKTLSELIN